MPLLETFGNASVRGFRRLGPTGGATDFQLISTQVLGATATSVTFNSIPSTFRHLQIRSVIRQSTTGTMLSMLTFNGSGTGYAWHRMYGTGSLVASDNSISTTQILAMPGPGGSDTSGIFMPQIIDVLDYGQTNKNKTVRTLTGAHMTNTQSVVALTSGLWANTAAVTSVNLAALSGSFAVGSRFSLYGWN